MKSIPDDTLKKRPWSVIIAVFLFWVMGLSILDMHIFMTAMGIYVLLEYAVVALLLSAALLDFVYPRKRITYYSGAMALTVSVVRGLFTALTQYQLRIYFPNILGSVFFSLCISSALAWLSYRYICGTPSRRYFQISEKES